MHPNEEVPYSSHGRRRSGLFFRSHFIILCVHTKNVRNYTCGIQSLAIDDVYIFPNTLRQGATMTILAFVPSIFQLVLFVPTNSEVPRVTVENVSAETQACIDCHENYTPGLVADWRMSRHSKTIPQTALSKPAMEKRVSSSSIPSALQNVVVGCYECHSLRGSSHKDNFEHFGYNINVVVSPGDCETCHSVEVQQYSDSKKAHARGNLQKNPVYHLLVETITGVQEMKQGRLVSKPSSPTTNNETCYGCHGTNVEVKGMRTVDTDAGEIQVPDLANWPNHGVGRVNPDGSQGTCTACHARHSFSIEVARKPHTCGQCHLEPDVPAYNIYLESKHGNIFETKRNEMEWNAVPWVIGKNITVPTCATCHNSLVTNPAGTVIAERTHDFGGRLWVRIFGLVFSHPQPKSGATFEIKNADGLPLPTTFGGKPASQYLLTREEQNGRRNIMKDICKSCHASSYAEKHFAKLDSTIVETDKMTLAATQILTKAWDEKLANKTNPFDEPIEKLWIEQWLFYANSVRYASAMSGPDFASFKHGWWDLSKNLKEMEHQYEVLKAMKKKR